MKNSIKVFSVSVLAVAAIVAFGVAAFAADNGSSSMTGADAMMSDHMMASASSSSSSSMMGSDSMMHGDGMMMHAMARPPMLQIGPNGNFLGRGMLVQTVASTSFQATVWGVTYTIVPADGAHFFMKQGNAAGTNPGIQAGDEIGVSGTVSASNPLTVQAAVVRDYSVTAPRAMSSAMHGDAMMSHDSSDTMMSSQDKLNDLLKKLQALQAQAKAQGGENASGSMMHY